MDIVSIIIGMVGGLAGGFTITKVLQKSTASNLLKRAKKDAASILKDANLEGENIKKDKLLQAKEKFLELKSEHEKEILSKDKRMAEVEKRIRDKESQVSSELAKAKKVNDDYEAKTAEYESKLEVLNKKQQEIERIFQEKVAQEEKETAQLEEKLIKEAVDKSLETFNNEKLSRIEKDRIEQDVLSFWEKYFGRLCTRAFRRDLLSKQYCIARLEEQDYKCALTGVELTCILEKGTVCKTNASIDRIDPKGPYTRDNVQLVCAAINKLRVDMSVDDFINWCKKVSDHALRK
jgi:hypothetical protein